MKEVQKTAKNILSCQRSDWAWKRGSESVYRSPLANAVLKPQVKQEKTGGKHVSL